MSEYCYNFPMPAVTATMTIFFDCRKIPDAAASFMVLNAVRSDESDAYPSFNSIPGGFLNAGKETVEETAIRETWEETRLKINEEDLHLYHVSSNPDTDPREHVVNVCYYLVLDGSRMKNVHAGDDVQKITFRTIESYSINQQMAFDHLNLVRKAIIAARKEGFSL